MSCYPPSGRCFATTSWTRWTRPGPTRWERSLALTVVVCGETYRDLVVQGGVPDMSAEQWRERLRSNLVDFVAESRFGWGQNRDSR